MMPAVFGPLSCRRNERLIVNWSNVDNSLICLNVRVLETLNPEDWCGACYDDGIARTFYPCHRPWHQPPLTAHQFEENERMKAMRISVEWTRTQVKSLWAAADNHKNKLKLEVDHNLVCSQMRPACFIANCVTCRLGSQTATCFGMDPPPLEQCPNVVPWILAFFVVQMIVC
jgi:hypothetical protein